MKVRSFILSLLVILLMAPSCVRRPSSYSRTVHPATHDTSLAGKVQMLANQVESKFKSDNYTINDIQNWAEQFTAYVLEYSLSTQNLTDAQCESIEYNLGRIAGVVYKDGVVPVMKELEEIEEGINNYEERSKKWEGAAERGFNIQR